MTDRNDSSRIQEYLRQTDRYFSDAEQTPSLIVHQRPSSVPTPPPPTPARKRWPRIALICSAVLVAVWLLMPPMGDLQLTVDVIDDHVQLSWNHFGSIGATYRLERKLGSETEWQVLSDSKTDNAYVDNTAKPDDRTEYRVSVCKFGIAFASAQKTLEITDSIPVSGDASATPAPASRAQLADLSVSYDAERNHVSLTWNVINGEGAEFAILRATGDSDTFVYLTSTTETSFVDGSVRADTAYTYQIDSRVDRNIHDSITHQIKVPATPTPKPTNTPTPAPTPFARLTDIRATYDPVQNQVRLSWSCSNGDGAEFTIKRADGTSDLEYYLATVSDADYYIDSSVQAGTSYTYRVTAQRDQDAHDSLLYLIDIPAPTTPTPTLTPAPTPFTTLTSISATYNPSWKWVRLYWSCNNSTGAEFFIYRAEGNSHLFTYLATVSNAYSYTDKTVLPGESYTYRVTAQRNQDTHDSLLYLIDIPAPATPTPTLTPAPTPFTNLTSIGATYNPYWKWVRLYWSCYNSTGAEFFIYRAEENSNLFTYLGTVSNAYSYTDKTVQVGKSYTYRVSSRRDQDVHDSKDYQIDIPAPATPTPTLTPTPAPTPAPTPRAQLSDFKAYYDPSLKQVRLSWSCTNSQDVQYVITRAEGNSNSFISVATLTNGRSHINKDVQEGVSYTYRISAIRNQDTHDYMDYRITIPTSSMPRPTATPKPAARSTWPKVTPSKTKVSFYPSNGKYVYAYAHPSTKSGQVVEAGGYRTSQMSSTHALFIDGDCILIEMDYMTVGVRRVYFRKSAFAWRNYSIPTFNYSAHSARTTQSVTPRWGPGSKYTSFDGARISSGTSLRVYFEESGYVFAEFDCSLGTVRAWIDADYVQAR